MNPRDLTRLNGQSVIVKSTMPPRNPPKQLSGIIEARADAAGEPKVKIVLEFSDLTNAAARRGVIGLEAADVDRLLASERNAHRSRPRTDGSAGGVVSRNHSRERGVRTKSEQRAPFCSRA
jgi:hypothetical protein